MKAEGKRKPMVDGMFKDLPTMYIHLKLEVWA